jgi:hypothetical protein
MVRDKRIYLRMDPGAGKGHHAHVKTGGKMSKFGIDASSCEEVAALVKAIGATVVGLHAHVGSGILKEADNWEEVGTILYGYGRLFLSRSFSLCRSLHLKDEEELFSFGRSFGPRRRPWRRSKPHKRYQCFNFLGLL